MVRRVNGIVEEQLRFVPLAAWLILVSSIFLFPLRAATPHDIEIEKLDTSYRFETDGSGQATVFERWRVITEAGRKRASPVSIPYVNKIEEIHVNFFRTLKKDGSKVEGDLAQIFDRTPPGPEMIEIFSDDRVNTFVVPNVEPGDVVEFEFVRRFKSFLKERTFWCWYTQQRSNVVLSETVQLDIPSDLRVAFHESPSIPHKIEEQDGRRVERWQMSNAEPASRFDQYSEPVFSISTVLNWGDFGDWIRSLNEPRQQLTPKIRELAAKLTAGKTTERARINAIYTYVSEKVRYVSIDFGIGRIQPHAASEVLRNAYGDCKDKHTLLAALLNAIGVRADAVLMTPGVGVFQPEVPMPQFLHEFTRVQTADGLLFLDSTSAFAPPGVLMPGVRGKKALVVGSEQSQIIEIPSEPPIPNHDAIKLVGAVDASGKLEGTIRMEFQGMDEPAMRAFLLEATSEQREQFSKSLAATSLQHANLTAKNHSDPKDLDQPFWLEYSILDPAFLPPNALSRRLAPFGSGTVDLKNLMGRDRPSQPVPVDQRTVEMSIDLKVDPAFTITNDMPVHYSAPFGSYDSDSSYDKGHVYVTGELKLNGKPVEPSDWGKFLDFWSMASTDESRGFQLERHASSRPLSATAPSTDRVRSLLSTGVTALRTGDVKAAQSAFEEATRLDPTSGSAWNDLGRAYAAQRQWDKAEKAYRRQIEINPKDLYAYNNLGVARRAQGHLADAIELYQKQAEVSPRDRFAHANLASAFGSQGNWKDAVREGQIAVEIDPTNAAIWQRLGQAQIKVGQRAAAAASFDRAIANSKDMMLRNNVAYEMIEGQFDAHKAWQLISEALSTEALGECHPTKPILDSGCTAKLVRLGFMLDTAGWIRFKEGQMDEAKQYVLASYAIAPKAVAALHLALILARSGDMGSALRFYVMAQSAPGFDASSVIPIRADLEQIAGGDTEFQSRLEILAKSAPVLGEIDVKSEFKRSADIAAADYKMIALVDSDGRVLDATMEKGDEPVAGALDYARQLALPPLSWPGERIQSVRIIEIQFAAGKEQRTLSYVVLPQTAPVAEATAQQQ